MKKNFPTFVNPWLKRTPPSTVDNVTNQYKATKTSSIAITNLSRFLKLLKRALTQMKNESLFISHQRQTEVSNVLGCEPGDPAIRSMEVKVRTIVNQNLPSAPVAPNRVLPENCPSFDFVKLGHLLQETLAVYDEMLIVCPALLTATMYEAMDFIGDD